MPSRAEAWGAHRLLALALLIGCAAALLVVPPLYRGMLGIIEAVAELIRHRPAAGIVAFVLLAALSAMVAFVSSAVLIPIAVHVWGPALCALLLWAGWFLGGVVTYAVGRYLGRPIVERLVRPATIARYEAWASSGVALIPILLVQLAVPSDVAGYVFGIVRCRPMIFFVALAVVEVPYALGAVYLGVSFLEGDLLALSAVGLAGLGLSAWALSRLPRHAPPREDRLRRAS